MAKQAGPFFFTGTIGDVIFYKSGEQFLIRMKGDYNKKKMQKPGAYPLMQLKQAEFGQASKLASKVYRTLPRSQKKQGLFGDMTREARKLLRENKTHEEIIVLLKQHVATLLQPATTNKEILEQAAGTKKKPLKQQRVQPAVMPSLVSLPTHEAAYREPLHVSSGINQTAVLEMFYQMLAGHFVQLSPG